jgi:hypothetical protein
VSCVISRSVVTHIRINHNCQTKCFIKLPVGQQPCVTGDLSSVKLKLQSTVKIEPQSVLACFTHWILLYQMVETGLDGLHGLYTIKRLFICHGLFGKFGLILDAGYSMLVEDRVLSIRIFAFFPLFLRKKSSFRQHFDDL